MTFAVLGFVSPASAQVEDQPSEVHLTWDHDDTAHTIVITWTTKYANSGDTVWYDTTSGGRDPTQYRYSATGSHYAYPDASEYFHEVELTDLTPDTLYYFICRGVNGGYSIERRFQTAPDRSTNITFVAGGDSRTNPQMRDNISQEMATFNPSFVVYTGDAVDNGSIEEEWDNWFTGVDRYWVTEKTDLSIPVIPALGNHEENATLFYDQYGLPGNHRWFSLDWGPDLHLIVLDSYASPAGAERNWLESDLAVHVNTLWKVVFFHQPVFSGGEQGSTVDLQEHWVPLFDKYHVDLVINGHDHDYERTYPINFSVSENSPVSGPERGTVYIVSGGWGAPLYEGSPQWWTAYGPVPIYHFTLIDINPQGTLTLKAIDKDGKVFDEYVIQKNPPVGQNSSPAPLVALVLIGCLVLVVITYSLLRKRLG
ncbi:MAG: metallophosphoesterase family protein [Methanomicrobiales archaeon]|nr:metallophosphoesterase family protein [Methanomicrobiales archaeon]